MPMPLWWGHINKRVFNPRSLRNGKWQVIEHVGRSSGTTYHTPIDALRVDDGVIVVLVYGSRSDWVRNVLASGTAELDMNGETLELVEPELISLDEAFALLPADAKRPPKFLKIDECLHMRSTT